MTQLVLPLLNQTGKNEWLDVESNLVAIREILNGELDNDNLSGSAGIVDANLASPNNSVYRSLLRAQNFITFETGAGTFILGSGSATGSPKTSGSNLITSPAEVPPSLRLAEADHKVVSKTLKLRLRAQASVNATKPTLKYTFGLYPFTVAGGGTELTMTLGTVVSGSTLEFNEPAASTVTSKETADFAIPADGAYVLGCVTSAKLNGGTAAMLAAELQARSV